MVFLPKDKEEAIRFIQHELYGRLRWCETVQSEDPALGDDNMKEYRRGYDGALQGEIDFLRTLLDLVERS